MRTRHVTEDEMSDLLETWNGLPDDGVSFHDWLGLTWDEYGAWVEQRASVIRVQAILAKAEG